MQEILDAVDLSSCEAAREYDLMLASAEVDFRQPQQVEEMVECGNCGDEAFAHLPDGTPVCPNCFESFPA